MLLRSEHVQGRVPHLRKRVCYAAFLSNLHGRYNEIHRYLKLIMNHITNGSQRISRPHVGLHDKQLVSVSLHAGVQSEPSDTTGLRIPPIFLKGTVL